MWRAVPSSSSSARTAAPRCPRTSRSARTAARACASGRPSSTRAASPARSRAPARAAEAEPPASRARSPASAPTAGRTRRSSLVLVSVVVTLGLPGRRLRRGRPTSRWSRPLDGEYWQLVTTLFVYDSTGYELVALGAIFLFGWLLERRHGAWAPLLVFFARRRRRLGARASPLDDGASRCGANARRARRCSPPGRCATCSPAAAARRTTPTCSACSRSRSLLVLLPLAVDGGRTRSPALGGGVVGHRCSGSLLARAAAALARRRSSPARPSTSRPTTQPVHRRAARAPRRAGRRRSSRRTAGAAAARARASPSVVKRLGVGAVALRAARERLARPRAGRARRRWPARRRRRSRRRGRSPPPARAGGRAGRSR